MIWIVISVLPVALGAFYFCCLRRRETWQKITLSDIDPAQLFSRLKADLALSAEWPASVTRGGIKVSAGWLPERPCKAYRSELDLEGSLEEVARFIADEMLERLGDWNREFQDGTVVKTVEDSPERKAWLIQVFYKTPPIMKNREYLHYLARQNVDDDQIIIAYLSVDEDIPIRPGYVRGVLYPTVHRLTRLGEARTHVEHILVNDIRGGVSLWVQNHIFTKGFIAANLRDSESQQRIFSERP